MLITTWRFTSLGMSGYRPKDSYKSLTLMLGSLAGHLLNGPPGSRVSGLIFSRKIRRSFSLMSVGKSASSPIVNFFCCALPPPQGLWSAPPRWTISVSLVRCLLRLLICSSTLGQRIASLEALQEEKYKYNS